MGTFSIIPCRNRVERYAKRKQKDVELSSPRYSLLHNEYGMNEILAPRLHNALSIG